tara:strand:- start:410 stop:730 length:321 start_codon:yes stop_codon:yes gene_type:complete
MYQIFVKDRCTNRGKIHNIEVTVKTTMTEFKKKVYKKTNVPSQSQKFLYQTKYLNDDDLILDQIYFDKKLNWASVDLMFRWHGAGCSCLKCGNIILLRNGKRVNRI